MNQDLTKGPIIKSMLLFAVPMILGNLLQQCYNIADTFIVGRFLGSNALAAVGSSFTLMTFLTSILLGLCMGSGAYFSICFGERNEKALKEGLFASFLLIAGLTVILNVIVFALLDKIEFFLQVPKEVWPLMRSYLVIIFMGITATFFYNYFASLLRAVGNSIVPLVFLAVSAMLNIILDLWFVIGLNFGVGGTVMAAFAAAVKIDAFAYMPVQDFGNAFSTFIAQNYGAKKYDRIRSGFKGAMAASFFFCIIVSAIVWIFARPLMLLFVDSSETAIIFEGVRYLHIEGAFYCGIGCLFLLYGLYRAMGKPEMSVVLTVISLGTRVVLAYILSAIPTISVVGIWWAVPIGWFLADCTGIIFYLSKKRSCSTKAVSLFMLLQSSHPH
ncbi:MAG: MATE family efflux transporter [Lachnospiraceae bacterium]|nr:MATE family efflux transporter [Lachnospiraceae bacterium]